MKTQLDAASLARPPQTRARRFAALAGCLALLLVPCPAARAGSILPALELARLRADDGSASLSKHYVEVDDGVWLAVKGRRERRQVRYARLPSTWSADQRQAAATWGFPVNRLRELSAGVLTETWSYPRVQVTFDADGRLIATR